MRMFVACLALLLSGPALASISTIDFVRIKNGNRDEAIYYYEQNWLRHRVEAMRVGVIESYELLVSDDPDTEFDILLITVYADEEQYEKREENFAEVMSRTAAEGRRLLNDIQPGDFREIVYGMNFESR